MSTISTVVFKLRVVNAHSRDAPGRNMGHLEYIGRRKGVVLNEGMKHGLFGNILDKKAEEIKSIQQMSRYVEKKTKEGTHMYRAIISLDEADAVRLGFDDRSKWQELIKEKMGDMADKTGIPIHRLEYSAAFHRDKGHPHVHILFWDKEQGVKEAFVKPKDSNQIRIGLIKHVFQEEMTELQQIKNEARKAATTNVGGFFDDFLKDFAEMTPKEYKSAMEEIKKESDLADTRLIYDRFPSSVISELSKDLFALRDKLPKTGRLNMKLMPPDVKDEIHDFIKKLLDNNVDCDREFKKYVSSAMELSKYYSDKPELHDRAGQQAYDDMMNRLSNVVLKAIKKINLQEREINKEIRQQAFQRQMMESLITEVFGVLARGAKAEDNKVQYAHRYGELSKQAKKELAKKLESDTGYDWER